MKNLSLLHACTYKYVCGNIRFGGGNAKRWAGEKIAVEERAAAVVSVVLAISLASRSYAEARLGHIGREKESRGGAYSNVTGRDAITRERATLATTRRQIACTLWYIVCDRAFKSSSRELRFASSKTTIARRERRLVGSTKACTLGLYSLYNIIHQVGTRKTYLYLHSIAVEFKS